MENASKVLLIAGAILMAIVVIAIAVAVTTRGRDGLDEIGDIAINSTLVTNQRNKFMKYEGEVTAAQAKDCVSAVLAHNSHLESDEGYLAISMYLPADIAAGIGGVTKVIERNKFRDKGGIESTYYMNNLSQKVTNSYIYLVTLISDANTGVIYRINIQRSKAI